MDWLEKTGASSLVGVGYIQSQDLESSGAESLLKETQKGGLNKVL